MNSSLYYKWHFASRYNLITVLELDNKFLCNEDPHAHKHPLFCAQSCSTIKNYYWEYYQTQFLDIYTIPASLS